MGSLDTKGLHVWCKWVVLKTAQAHLVKSVSQGWPYRHSTHCLRYGSFLDYSAQPTVALASALTWFNPPMKESTKEIHQRGCKSGKSFELARDAQHGVPKKCLVPSTITQSWSPAFSTPTYSASSKLKTSQQKAKRLTMYLHYPRLVFFFLTMALSAAVLGLTIWALTVARDNEKQVRNAVPGASLNLSPAVDSGAAREYGNLHPLTELPFAIRRRGLTSAFMLLFFTLQLQSQLQQHSLSFSILFQPSPL